ncbi:hypothetical protein KFL_000630340 [Klebsormidium nitens]|uniref:Uncharacterized protein n=1 Tax=Klebsormidium nitens TaxID=105231 RepID=A0A1Y1HSN9_KLENI|nr:hypothetical protein KFL_000630340 [Klebsormidium nitens]|eukprot:GAQ80832.1 hypothetical protein KFL_000630340 [Klebsormidium nitens]
MRSTLENFPYPHSDAMQAAFLAVLLTVRKDEQGQILRPWLGELLGSNEAWYEDVLNGIFGAQAHQRRLDERISAPARGIDPQGISAHGLLSGSPGAQRECAFKAPRRGEGRANTLANQRVQSAPAAPPFPTNTPVQSPFVSAPVPNLPPSNPVDAPLGPKKSFPAVSWGQLGSPQVSKTSAFGTTAVPSQTLSVEGAGDRDKGAPGNGGLTRGGTGGGCGQVDSATERWSPSGNRWLVTASETATPSAPAPQTTVFTPAVASSPPFVCDYPPNTSPFSEPFGLKESLGGGRSEGVLVTPQETLIDFYKSAQEALQAGLGVLGARPGANERPTRIKRTAAELWGEEPHPKKRSKAADSGAGVGARATDEPAAAEGTGELDKSVAPAAVATEVERNSVPAGSGGKGDRAGREAVAAGAQIVPPTSVLSLSNLPATFAPEPSPDGTDPAKSSDSEPSREDEVPSSAPQSLTEAADSKPRQKYPPFSRQALFQEERAVMNALLRAVHAQGGPNRAPVPLSAAGQRLRSSGLTVWGKHPRPSVRARQHPLFFIIHTKADPEGKDVPADVSLTQWGWEEAERLHQEEEAAKMTSAAAAPPLVSSLVGGGVTVARPVGETGGEGLECNFAEEGPEGPPEGLPGGLERTHEVGKEPPGEKSKVPSFQEPGASTGGLVQGGADGRSGEESEGEPKLKDTAMAPEYAGQDNEGAGSTLT